ncbi:MAG: site-2 protease family protein [Candidatus Omnitrophica bacterium]|nr:site-2 protease family protein [Candidatus Omnitrophota bacterium]
MLLELFSVIIMFFCSMVIHEYAHGWVACRLGDPTAKEAGRLTLNPLKHIDPLGTIILPGVLMLLNYLGMNLFVFGWAKPVPVNFFRLNNPRRDIIWVGLAGPVANVMFAAGLLAIRKFFPMGMAQDGLGIFVIINLGFAAFNMVPIPPLDGSRVVLGLLPKAIALQYARLERYGIIIIIILLYLGLMNRIVWPFVELLAKILNVNLT